MQIIEQKEVPAPADRLMLIEVASSGHGEFGIWVRFRIVRLPHDQAYVSANQRGVAVLWTSDDVDRRHTGPRSRYSRVRAEAVAQFKTLAERAA